MDRRDIYKYLISRLQIKFPSIDFSEHSMVSKLIVEPLAVALEDIFDLLANATNIDDDLIRILQARLYGIELQAPQSEAGIIEIDATGTTDINIPQGTSIVDLDTGATGITIQEVQYTKDEILSMKARGIKIKVPFRGDLPLGATVSLGNIGDYVSAVVVKEYTETTIEPPAEVLKNIFDNRPLLYGDSTRVAIEKKLAAFNAKVLDPMNPKNPILLFDKTRTVKRYELISYEPETGTIKQTGIKKEVEVPEALYGVEITP